MKTLAFAKREFLAHLLILSGTLFAVNDVSAQELDFGDARDTFPVTLAQDGARHVIEPGFHLGALIDAETDGTPGFDFNGDDLGNTDDEDGVMVGKLKQRGTGSITVTVTDDSGEGGFVDIWIDYNNNGDWETEEHIFGGVSQPVVAGDNFLEFDVPEDAAGSDAFYRVRLSRAGGLSPSGEAPGGEVEDGYSHSYEGPETEITGRVYIDNNENGVFDEGDSPLPAVVYLDKDDDGVQSTEDITAIADSETGLYSISTYGVFLSGTVRVITDVRGHVVVSPTTDYANIPVLDPTTGLPTGESFPAQPVSQRGRGPVLNGPGPVGNTTLVAFSQAILYAKTKDDNDEYTDSYFALYVIQDQNGDLFYVKETWEKDDDGDYVSSSSASHAYRSIPGIPEGQSFTPVCTGGTGTPGVVAIYGFIGSSFSPPLIPTRVLLNLNDCTIAQTPWSLTTENLPTGYSTTVDAITVDGTRLLVGDVDNNPPFGSQKRVIDVDRNQVVAVIQQPSGGSLFGGDIAELPDDQVVVVTDEFPGGSKVYEIPIPGEGEPPTTPVGHPLTDYIPSATSGRFDKIDGLGNVVGTHFGNILDGTFLGAIFGGHNGFQVKGIGNGVTSATLGATLRSGFQRLPVFTFGPVGPIAPVGGYLESFIPSGQLVTGRDFDVTPEQLELVFDLGLTKMVSAETAHPGELLTYTLEVTNYGTTDATGVSVRDDLPPGVTVNAVLNDHGPIPEVIHDPDPYLEFNIGNLAVGESKSVQLTLSTFNLRSLTNVAHVSSEGGGGDDNPSNDLASAVAEIIPAALIQFSAETFSTLEGDPVQISLTREGDLDASVTAQVDVYPGTADNPSDFTGALSYEVEFAPLQALQTIEIETVDDDIPELDKTFTLVIREVTSPDGPGSPTVATVTIQNDDGTPLNLLMFDEVEVTPDGVLRIDWLDNSGPIYIEFADNVEGPWLLLSGAGSPFVLGGDDPIYEMADFSILSGLFRLVETVPCTGDISGTVKDDLGNPVVGAFVRAGNGALGSVTDANGNFLIQDVPEGLAHLSFEKIVEIEDLSTSNSEFITRRVLLMVEVPCDVVTTVAVTMELPRVLPMAPCGCTPWTGIGTGVVDGVQTVSAFGGKIGDCDEPAEVTITGPGGISILNPKTRQIFAPAASGKWTVTATVCGEKKVSEITVP